MSSTLESHEEICSIRYEQIERRLSNLERKMDELQAYLTESKRNLATTVITASATVSASVLGLIVTILMKF
jgi:hypothetical protein